MWAASRRLRRLALRYRTDRRLPPVVRELYERTFMLRLRDRARRVLAAVRPVLGSSGRSAEVARLGGRRIAIAGQLDRPVDTAALDAAELVVGLLERAGLEPFVVERRGDRIVVGVLLADRQLAWRTLSDGLPEHWYAQCDESLVVALDRRPRGGALTSRSWTVFEARRLDRVVGPEAGVIVTFWEDSPAGHREMVGERGQARFDPRSAATTELIGGRRFPSRSAFPVGHDLAHLADPVDIVYTWVDDSDPAWRQAFLEASGQYRDGIPDHALDPARYRTSDELRYSLRSVWAYCGWVRRIFLVTAGQRPNWLADDPRVTVVDHREILPPEALPTFNSHAIEAALHRIPGLAERFVYFNDDMLVARPLRPETFFHPNGLAKVFPSDARVLGYEDEATLAVDTAARRGRELLHRRFGRVAAFKPLHSPYPLLRSVMDQIDREFPEEIDAVRHSRFRSARDVSTAASFAQHFAVATGRATFAEIGTHYVHVESGRLAWHLDRIRLADDLDTYCINDTADGARGPGADRAVAMFFAARHPVAAPWER